MSKSNAPIPHIHCTKGGGGGQTLIGAFTDVRPGYCSQSDCGGCSSSRIPASDEKTALSDEKVW